MHLRPLRAVFTGTLLLATSSLPAATVWYVDAEAAGNNTGTSWPNAFTDLQSALDVALDGQEIWIANGRYRPSRSITSPDSNGPTFAISKSITLYGGFQGGEQALAQRDWKHNQSILSGDLANNDLSGVYTDNAYHVVMVTGGSPVFDGLTVSGGRARSTGLPAGYGGGMYFSSGSPTIRNCTISGNSSQKNAAGIYRSSTTSDSLTITDSVFENNVADSGSATLTSAGALYVYRAATVIERCVFRGNAARYVLSGSDYCGVGGAIVASAAPLTIEDSVFENNTATGGAGAVYAGSTTQIRRSRFEGNHADIVGGVMWGSGTLIIDDCDFTGNSSATDSGDGGGTIVPEYGTAYVANSRFTNNTSIKGAGFRPHFSTNYLINCIFQGNHATMGGGAIHNRGGTVYAYNCLITGNRSDTGAALNNDQGGATLTQCTLAGNTSGDGGGIYVTSNSTTNTTTLANCIVWGNQDNYGTGETSQIHSLAGTLTINYTCVQGWTGAMGGTGNIGTDPLFVFNDTLYHLQETSPAIDAGNTALLPRRHQGYRRQREHNRAAADRPRRRGPGEKRSVHPGHRHRLPRCRGHGLLRVLPRLRPQRDHRHLRLELRRARRTLRCARLRSGRRLQ